MKARCINNKYFDPERKSFINYSYSLSETYKILSIDIFLEKGIIFLRIQDDEGIVKYPPAELFEIIDTQIPNQWVITLDNLCVSIQPKTFSHEEYEGKNSFWEDYYNGEELAIKLVNDLISSH